MDSGLRVQWPLSPYATALAAGALVGFCVALWKTFSASSENPSIDLRGQTSGKDLDPPKKEVGDKTKKEGKDSEKTGFPNLANRDVKPPDCESLCSSGAFGAIPRTVQRNYTLQTPQLYSTLRRRYVEGDGKTWHEINPVSSNFSCIYQQSFLFGNEVPKLDARFILNVSPNLNQYLKQFYQLRDYQFPEFPRKDLFRDFDVSINPDILKDKPITRSALCLALEKQLHKILGKEPLAAAQLSHRAIQTNHTPDENEDGNALKFQNGRNSDLESEHSPTDEVVNSPVSLECSNIITENSSLWDSGYCEKSLDERWISAREVDSDNYTNSPVACCSSSSFDSSDTETVLFVEKNFESSSEFYNKDHPSSSLKENIESSNLYSESTDSIEPLGDFQQDGIQIDAYSFPSGDKREIMSELSGKEPPRTSQENCEREESKENIPVNVDSDSGINVELGKGSSGVAEISASENESIENLSATFQSFDLDPIQKPSSSFERDGQVSNDEREHCFLSSENILRVENIQDNTTRVSGEGDDYKPVKLPEFDVPGLDEIQNELVGSRRERDFSLSAALKVEKSCSRVVLESDVTSNVSSRDLAGFEERETLRASRQMDRETGERSVAVESSVTTESTLRDSRLSTSVVSRLTLDNWLADREDSVSVKTTISEEIFRPTFEEFIPLTNREKSAKRGEESIPFEACEKKVYHSPSSSLPSSPRVDRLKGLLNRDEERRSRTKFQHLASDDGHMGGAMEGEWDRLLRDVLASVSELERWERRQCDVRSDAEDAEQHPSFSQSDSSFTMEEEALSPSKGETPTKVKNLRFKLDPDVFDVPSDDSFYDDDDDDGRKGWKKPSKYRAYSSLELTEEPVRLVSVHASVVPAGQKMVARPVGIDLRVRLTEERHSKRAHVSTSPSQAKRRSPVSDRGVGWCQELSPVTENVDWRETFTPVNTECKSVPNGKTVPNGILKTPSPKSEPAPVESPNPFKTENGVSTNGVSPVIEKKTVIKPKYNGMAWKPTERKPLSLPRKKFEPDPEAIERITGYKSALSKPPLPPPIPDKSNAIKLAAIKKAELARKQYLDNKAALSANKVDGMQKFQQFLNQAQNDRARIVTSVPDLVAIERAVTEQWMKERASVSPRESPIREDSKKNEEVNLSRGSTPDDKWASYVQSCRQHLGRRSQSMTYLETDIDIIPILDEDDKCVSTSALDESDEALPDPDDSDLDRSREDLDDSGRAKSEHELRIERSLRSLPLPDWYKRSEKPKTGFLLGSSAKEKRGWAAAKSLASSTSSLASCGLRRPVRSLRSSRENIPWSRSSASPDGPTLSLALAKAFREPYLGWRARTPTSSGVSSSPRASPPSWGATTTDDEGNGVSFDGEDAFGRTTSSEDDRKDEPLSLDDTGADAVTVSMDTNDPVKLPCGEDTCDDINNMSMDTCELFDASIVPVDEDPSPQADTGDDIDNLSTDTATENRKLDPKLKRYSYSQSIYHSEWEEPAESRGDRKVKEKSNKELNSSSPNHKIVWIESSFVGSRTTTSIMVLPESGKNSDKSQGSNIQERPASR